MIIELKIDSTPDDAIRQIKDKDYVLRFRWKHCDLLKSSVNLLCRNMQRQLVRHQRFS